MAHKVTIKPVGSDRWLAVCTCRKQSATVAHPQLAEDWEDAHMREVEKVRSRLASQPSLKVSRDYYEERAADPETPEGDRPLWQALADELTARLGDRRDPNEGQGALL